jgi:hypothetical protein
VAPFQATRGQPLPRLAAPRVRADRGGDRGFRGLHERRLVPRAARGVQPVVHAAKCDSPKLKIIERS